MDSIIEQLQKVTSYKVTEIGTEGAKTNTVSNYRAINSKYQEAEVVKEIATADLVSTIPVPLYTAVLSPHSLAFAHLRAIGHLRRRPQHPQVHRARHCQGPRAAHRPDPACRHRVRERHRRH